MYVSASSRRGGRKVHFSPRRTGPNMGPTRRSAGARACAQVKHHRVRLGDREPTGTRTLQSTGLDEISEERPLGRPAEPLPDLVLMREDRGANADEHELRERLVLIRLPRLVPHLVPAGEFAGVAVPAFPVVDRDVARHDGRERLELLADFLECRSGETELVLDVVELRRSRGSQVTHEARALVAGGIRLGERRAGQRIDRAHRGLMAEEHLAAMDLEREHAWPKRELAAPWPLRLRPRSESGGPTLVRFLVRRREEAGQRGVLCERENATIDEERLRLVERLELAIRREPAVMKPLLPELGDGDHADASARVSDSAVAFPPLIHSATVFPLSASRILSAAAVAAAPAPSATRCPSTRRSRIAR